MKYRALLFALALVVAGCGGAGAGPAATDESNSDTTEPTEADAPAGDENTLAAFFGWDEEFDPATARDQEVRIQELMRQCMAEQGFDYQPMLPPEDAYQTWEPEDQRDYAETEGFGVTTYFGRQDEMGDVGEEWIDPNQDAVEAMSESERQAWYDALYGSQEEQEAEMTAEIDEETGETYYYSEGYGTGCQGEAYEVEYGEQGGGNELYETFGDELDAMYERVQADPRIADLESQWSGCMSEAGYEFENREAMYNWAYEGDLQERFIELVGENGGYADPFEGWSEDEINAFFEEKTQEEIDAFFEDANSQAQADVDMDAIAALQEEERTVAVADLDCWGDSDQTYQEVSEEYEADFVSANRAALEEMRDNG